MLFDCFTYFNEKELLFLRYEMLKDVVDGFIVAEGNRTFRGDPKPYNCIRDMEQLGIPDDNLQVLHVELPTQEEILSPWIREHAQRDALSVGMRMCPPDSIFYLSDVDEIPKPDRLIEAAELVRKDPSRCVRLSMPMLYARGDLRVMDPERPMDVAPNSWVCGTTFSSQKLDQLPSQIRTAPNSNDIVVGNQDAGWHFSWMGTKESFKTKMASFSHCYDDIPNAIAPMNSRQMLDYIDNYVPRVGEKDMLGRDDHILSPYDLGSLPPEALRLETVRNFLLPEEN